MQNIIKKYQVKHPLLQKYIKFFWELRIDQIQLNHKLIPQRNINMRINLSNTHHSVCHGKDEKLFDDVYFLGLQNKFTEAHLKVDGDLDVIGICFKPYGFFPFLKIPVSEFKNQILGADEIGFSIGKKISEQMKEISDTTIRLAILEKELLTLLDDTNRNLDKFPLIFDALIKGNSFQLNEFCKQNNINIRQLERLFSKYVGLSPNSYTTLDRFHCTINQLLYSNYAKLSDLAYDNRYFDQMHFIKEFKRYSGTTPNNLINKKNSILQIGNWT